MLERDDVLDKIRKLLRLATSPNEHEAAKAAAKAQELLFKYKLSMVDVESSMSDDAIIEDTSAECGTQKLIKWKGNLANVIAKNYYGFCLVSPKQNIYGERVWKIHFIGKAVDIEVMKYLYEYLSRELARLAEEKWQEVKFMEMEHGKAWKNAFYFGAINTINRRLMERQAELVQETGEKAIVLVNRDQGKVKQFVASHYPRLGKGQGSRINSGSGYSHGVRAGQSVSLNRPLPGSGRKMLP